MHKGRIAKLLTAAAMAASFSVTAAGKDFVNMDCAPRIETDFYSGWSFYPGDNPAVKDDSAPNGGRIVTIPHDWQIESPARAQFEASQGFFERSGVGWYRKEFELEKAAPDTAYLIYFERVFDRAEVFVNGKSAGSWMYGYMSFSFDITRLLRPGKNVLAVRVDNSKGWSSRWYSGAGITGEVKLIQTGATRIDENGIDIVSDVDLEKNNARVRVSVDLAGPGRDAVVLFGTLSRGTQKFAVSGKPGETSIVFNVPNPALWSAETPNLYDLELTIGGDRRKCKAGIRKVEFIPRKGLFVNGQNVKLKGGCLHIDGGGIGAATSEWSWRRRLNGLKTLGINAIRCSHNPYPTAFYRLCDELGFYVIDEVWDKWDYPYVVEDWERILHDFLARDRKHACVILWSVGNEVADQGGDKMIATLKKFTSYVKKFEPTRPTAIALIAWFSHVPPSGPDDKRGGDVRAIGRILEYTDVLMPNYQEFLYDRVLAAYPDTLIIGSEVYQYFRAESNEFKVIHDDNPWFFVTNRPEVIGSFQWTAVAYLGESMGWPLRGWPAALIRTDESRMPISWLLQSYWSDEPFVKFAVFDGSLRPDGGNTFWSSPKMSTHWNYQDREALDCAVFSNCDEIQVKVNNTVFPRRKPADYANRFVRGWLAYSRGTVTVTGFRDGKTVAKDVVRTAGAPAYLEVKSDRAEIRGDRYDLCYFRIQPKDKDGILCEKADNLVRVSVTGPGEIVAVDNGDLINTFDYKSKSVPLFRGGASVVVKANPGESGEIKLTVESDGLRSGTASTKAVSGN